jgi:penicillin-binding protein 1A
MLQRIKNFWYLYISTPISRLFKPVANVLANWLSPLGRIIQPYKERLDERWAYFAANNPTLATWTRRGTKIAVGLYVLYFIFAIGFLGEIPTVDELKEMQTLNTSEVLTMDSVLIGKFYKENRKDISFEEIPKHVVNALISNEDVRYWDHSGVDYQAFGRVLIRSIIKGDDSGGGGSTIPQQLAKNLFGRRTYTILSMPINKIREMLVARRLERAYDKKNLLAFYLNTVPFGGNVFGIEMASKRFFNKTTNQLTVEEGAVIVGMLTANTRNNPKRNPETAFKRRNVVLSQMVKNQALSQKAYDSLKVIPIKLNYQPVLNRDNMAPYFKDYLRTLVPELLTNVKKEDGSAYDIYKDGLKIYTTIDSKMQRLAEETVQDRMAKLQKVFDEHWAGQGKWWGDDKWLEDAMRKSERWKKMAADGMSETKIRNYFLNAKIPTSIFAWENGAPSEDERTITPLDSIKYYFRQLNTGFMVMDSKTGLVKAWVGGTDFNFFQYDHVKSKRQVGSTFKPIVYAKALQSGVRPCEYIPNQLTSYLTDGRMKPYYEVPEDQREDAWTPRNSDDSYSGAWSLEGALTNSVNVVSARLIQRVGVTAVRELAKNMGVTSELQNDMSIALGSGNISLFDMMKVYGTFAARGRRPEPISVLKITTRDGKTVIADFTKNIKPEGWLQILTPDHADMMTKMLKSVVNDGTASRLRSTYSISTDIAGKTGTTQNHSDGWFMCYTPNLVCGAWVGGITPAVRFREITYGQGAYMALPICGTFIQKLYETPHYAHLKKEKFPVLSKALIDSMDCDDKRYSEYELARFDSMRLQDSISEATYTPILPEVKPQEPAFDEGEDHDLRDNKKEDNKKPLPSAGVLPSVKPEIKQQNQVPTAPKIDPKANKGKQPPSPKDNN